MNQNILYGYYEKVSKLVIYFITNLLIARELGPEMFGMYNLGIAISVVFVVFAAAGVNGLVVREYRSKNIGPSIFLDMIIWRSVKLIILYFFFWLFLNDYLKLNFSVVIFSLILSLTSLFLVVDVYCEATINLRKVFYYKACGYIAGLIMKVSVLFFNPKLELIMMAHLLEYLFISLLSFRFIHSEVNLKMNSIRLNCYLHLMWKSLPLLLSTGVMILYVKMDVIMLQYFLGSNSVGIYSAGSRIFEAFLMFSIPIVSTCYPVMQDYFNAKRDRVLRQTIRKFQILLLMISILIILLMFLYAGVLIHVLFGAEYANSVIVLNVLVIALPAVFIGDLLTKFLIMKEQLYFVMFRNVFGLSVNLILNILLIPNYGLLGAAIASVLGYFTANLAYPLLNMRMRSFFTLNGDLNVQ